MGQSIVRALRETPQLHLVGAVASAGSVRLGLDAGGEGMLTGVSVSADPVLALAHATMAVEFSAATSVAEHVRACRDARVPILVGTTGYDAATRASLEHAAKDIAVLISPNTSVGVTVMLQLVALATEALGAGYEVDIAEIHHRLKRDAPSGTALALGERVAAVRGQALKNIALYDKESMAAGRAPGTVGFNTIRAGDVVGEHTVLFTANGERLEITHRAMDRMTFARGALRAALWLSGRPAGLYEMTQVLGL